MPSLERKGDSCDCWHTLLTSDTIWGLSSVLELKYFLEPGLNARVSNLSLLTVEVEGSLCLAAWLSVSSRGAKSYLGDPCGQTSEA